VILDGIHCYGYTSMGGHIIPEAEKANTAVRDGFVRQLSTSHIFLSPLPLPFFGKNWELDLLSLKIPAGS